MIYDILEEKLATHADLVRGTSLFRLALPSECAIGVMVRTSLSGIQIDPAIPGWYQTDMQVVVRHVDPVEGYTLATQVADLLFVETREDYSGSSERGAAHITLFQPKHLPIQFPRLDGNGFEFSQHFIAAFGFSRA
jgi:hypothetical protein